MEGSQYVCRVGEPWADFPSGDESADALRMNRFIEAEVLKAPEQYYWLHKRFKTRPPGEQRIY
jgi:KDO2-lipid IV(A) lauroyltransferase